MIEAAGELAKSAFEGMEKGMEKSGADKLASGFEIPKDNDFGRDATKSEGGGFEVPRDGALDAPKQQGENVGGVEAPKKDISDIPNLQEGGAYKDLPNIEGMQKHHIPANSTTELPYGDGPCISMDKEDHEKTASYGASNDAKKYRAEQKELIDQGKFGDALQMDIDDIRGKFGDKYDQAIAEAQEYYKKLKEEGRIQ